MLWWLPENGDLIGNHKTTETDQALWHKTLAAQALEAGLCPQCYLEGKDVKLKRMFSGTGWSNQSIAYHCPICCISVIRNLCLQWMLRSLTGDN